MHPLHQMVDSALGVNSQDCQEPPYCSKCKTRGHILAKCPSKRQNNRQPDEKHKNADRQQHKKCKNHKENWKKAQDQPQFSYKDNRCLNCAGNHRTHDCPMRHNHKHPLLAILLMVQVFIKIIHNFKIILLNSFHNKANLLLTYQPLL